jgi:hypothetical protein
MERGCIPHARSGGEEHLGKYSCQPGSVAQQAATKVNSWAPTLGGLVLVDLRLFPLLRGLVKRNSQTISTFLEFPWNCSWKNITAA